MKRLLALSHDITNRLQMIVGSVELETWEAAVHHATRLREITEALLVEVLAKKEASYGEGTAGPTVK